MDVFLLLGQSNMAGRADLIPSDKHRDKNQPLIINGHSILSFSADNKWIPASDPLHYDKPSKCGIGPGLSFGKLIAELNIVDNNRSIGLIPCAIGGTSIKEWLPFKYLIKYNNDDDIDIDIDGIDDSGDDDKKDDIDDGIFENVISKTKTALNSDDINDIELRAILWHQGESDCYSLKNAQKYLSFLIILFNNLRLSLNNNNIPIIVAGLSNFLGSSLGPKSHNFKYYNILNQNLMLLPLRIFNCSFISTNDLTHCGDYLHFDRKSSIILGHRYAKEFAKLSGELTKEEINNKYKKLIKFTKNVLQKQKCCLKTGISFKTWCVLLTVSICGIYAYKKYYAKKNDNNK